MGTKAYPPVIVWGLGSQIGLGIVRELGQYGIPVIGLFEDDREIGIVSCYVREAHRALERGPALIEQIQRIGTQTGARAVIAVAETNCLFLAKHKEELAPVVALVPSAEALLVAMDKDATVALAQRHGIDVPRSAAIGSRDCIDCVASQFDGHVVLKWSRANEVVPYLAQAGLPFIKAEHVYSSGELRDALHRYDSLNCWPSVQEYCSGQGLGLFFFLHAGRVYRKFQHLRIAEWPPEGGFSSVCDGVPLTEHRHLQEKCEALLKDIGWEGVAMVEFRFDARTGRAVLMEINGRYWGSYPLAVHSGVGFSLYSYFFSGLGQTVSLPEPRTDLRGRMVATELKRLVRILFRHEAVRDREFVRRPWYEVWRFVSDFLRIRCRYFVFRFDDPMPWFKDLKNLFGKKRAVHWRSLRRRSI